MNAEHASGAVRGQAVTMLSMILMACALARPAMAQDLPAEVQQVIDLAAANGLPVSGLEEKALEGVAKGVPSHRIVAAVQQQADWLAKAAALVPNVHDEQTLQAVALALRAGASERAVLDLLTLSDDLRDAALEGVSDLMASGFTEGQATELVRTAAAASDPDLAMAQVVTVANGLVVRGESPAEATSSVSAAVSQGRTPLGVLQEGSGGERRGPPAHAQGTPSYGNGNGNREGGEN